eukprot:TRINITY_DN1598_c0_g1_i1.p1 TRINITY_DN1598_c0_g1~~TRINITY_DN1598_c0_g1_i1.p1  ORF type:complete len:433 (+),score=117.21 TRINITY_DN1598_c0_g1_i1:111-1301(+)
MAAWKMAMCKRSKSRTYLASLTQAMSGLTEGDMKLLFPSGSPTWVEFTDFQRVRWLNRLLLQLWSYINKAVSTQIRASVEPVLERCKPMAVSSIKFYKLTLGTIPPEITGIHMMQREKGKLTIDIDFKWAGDPDIILQINSLGMSLPVQLKNLRLASILRVDLHFCEGLPCIGALVVSLMMKPHVDYALNALGGSFTSMPGISDIIKEVVDKSISSSVLWPKRIISKLKDDFDTTLLQMLPIGQLKTVIVAAHGLEDVAMASLVGHPDTYVMVKVEEQQEFISTQVVKNSTSPRWEQTLNVDVYDFFRAQLVLKVLAQKLVGGDVLLGVAELPLEKIDHEADISMTLPIMQQKSLAEEAKQCGVIDIKLHFHEYNMQERLLILEKQQKAINDAAKK